MAFGALGITVYYRIAPIREFSRAEQILGTLLTFVGIAMMATQLAVAFGALPRAAPDLYTAALLFYLFVSIANFAMLVFSSNDPGTVRDS